MQNCNAEIKKLAEANKGELPFYAWPGGYPIYYLDDENNVLCPTCANANDEYSSPLVAYDIHEEDDELCCDHCSKVIAESTD